MSNVQYVPSSERFRFSIAHCSLLIAHFGRPDSPTKVAKKVVRQRPALSKFELAVVPELTAGMSFLAKTRAVRTL